MTALLLILAANPNASADEKPAHIIVCEKALCGDFGELGDWQREGYRAVAARGQRKVAWVTHYATGEPGVGTRTASGRRVENGRTSAMLDVPFGTFVLVNKPEGYTLRQVWDRGSRRNIGRARRRGAQTWVDLYVHRRMANVSYVRPVWVAGGAAR